MSLSASVVDDWLVACDVEHEVRRAGSRRRSGRFLVAVVTAVMSPAPPPDGSVRALEITSGSPPVRPSVRGSSVPEPRPVLRSRRNRPCSETA